MGIIYLSPPPPNGDRVKPICILGETILKSCLPISSFHSFFYPSTKFYKNCGQVDKKENSKKTISSSFILSCQSLDFGQEAAFLFYVFFMSFKKLAKSVDWWTSNENYEKNIFNLMYILICKCGYVDKKVFFYFIFSFCYVLFTILTKKCGQVDQK